MTPPASSAAARRLTEFLLSDIVAISADAIICIDANQKITLFNEGAEQIFGWTAAEVMGQPLEILLPERTRKVHAAHVERFGQSQDRARRMGQRREISGVRKNGEEFPAEAAIAKVRMGDSVVFSVVLRDITEQVELQRRLQNAIQARDDTVGVVAHDLRNPVSAVKMLSSALLQSDDIDALPPEASEQLRLIRASALQMDRLIQDLLDVTRIETGRLPVDKVPVSAAGLLESALQTLRPLVKEAGITLREDVPPALPQVEADAERIGQVLSNLVGNAIKFTTKGGQITVSARAEADVVRVSVTDTGTGISREQLPHIFDRFWQSSQSSIRSRGAGLGLPIARGIVRAHGGELGVESEPGKGSTFFFSIPIAGGPRTA